MRWEFGFALTTSGLQKTLGYSPWTSLYSHPKAKYHGSLSTLEMTVLSNVNATQLASWEK